MTSTDVALTLREAALVADVPFGFARREVEKRTLRPHRDHDRLFVPTAASLYLAVVHSIASALQLSRPLRASLYALLTKPLVKPSSPWTYDDDSLRLDAGGTPVTIDVGDLHMRVDERLRILGKRGERIHSDPEIKGGVPVFKGTRIPVENVGVQRLQGASDQELLDHYPALQRDDFELAAMVVALGKKPGRPKAVKPLRILRVP